jgi:hypothetical protein
LVLSVVCCGGLPQLALSIVGVVFASRARASLRAGDGRAAQDQAATAKALAIASGVLLGVRFLAVLLLVMFGFTSMLLSAPWL